MPLRIGDKLGPYEIVDTLGKGGMGEVYRARDARLKRDVAIKTSNTAFSDRFQREAEAIAALSHPNICTLFDVGPDYLVMELVEGPTLGELIKKGPLPVAEALRIAGQIADALEAAHAKNIVHRDLKPGNVKIRPDGLVKVLDFGLAKVGPTAAASSPEDSPTLTMGMTEAGMILGTAGYMAPEQARGESVDHRADVWAFGVILYEMLSGARLYSGPTVSDTLAAVLLKEPDWSKIPAPELSSIGRLLRWCLEKDPKKRLSDISMAKRLLVEDPAAPAAPNLPPVPSRTRLRAAALGLGVVLLSLGAFAYLRPPAQPPLEPVAFHIDLSAGQKFEQGIAVAPDGRSIAYLTRNTNGRVALMVRALNSIEPRELVRAAEDAVYLPFWSPDGRWVGFGSGSQIKKVEATGGTPQVVGTLEGVFTGGTWSPDGTIVFSSRNSAGKSTGLWKVSGSGGTPVQMLHTELVPALPSFLPDGKHFLWTLMETLQAGNVFAGSTDAASEQWPKERIVTSASSPTYIAPLPGTRTTGLLVFARDLALMAQPFDPATLRTTGEAFRTVDRLRSSELVSSYAVSASGTLAYRTGGTAPTTLTWLDFSGKSLGEAAPPAAYTELNLSPDGTQLAAVKDGDIWLLDLQRKTSLRFTSDAAEDRAPVWSPDGSRIVFASNRKGHFDLYEKKSSNTSTEQPLWANAQNKTPNSWSPDGKWLVFTQDGGATQNDLMLLSMTEPSPATADRVRIFLQGPSQEGQAAISPDGKWIAYASLESGSVQSYMRAFPSGENPRKLAEGQGAELRWRPDGRELFFNFSSKGSFRSVEVSPQGALGEPRMLFEDHIVSAGGFHRNPNYVVSRDGKRLLAAMEAEDAADSALTVILNWQAGLRP